jgi:hypothetical protein
MHKTFELSNPDGPPQKPTIGPKLLYSKAYLNTFHCPRP